MQWMLISYIENCTWWNIDIMHIGGAQSKQRTELHILNLEAMAFASHHAWYDLHILRHHLIDTDYQYMKILQFW